MDEGPIQLLNILARDGSRHFAAIPDRFGPLEWPLMIDQLNKVPGVSIRQTLQAVNQSITDFRYGEFDFIVDTQIGELWLFVIDPNCPTAKLREVADFFGRLKN